MTKPIVATLLLLVAFAGRVDALVVGQVDTFQNGTTSGWLVGLLGAAHPAPPVVIPTGGPNGGNDAWLRLTAVGGAGAGSRLSVLNGTQWAGDYIASGIGTIELDLLNFGPSELSIRLMFENPQGGPPTDIAISNTAVVLAPGGAWTHAVFTIDPALFTALAGDAATALATTTLLRIFHASALGFPEPVLAQLGVDNIRAGTRAVAEPGSAWLLFGVVAAALARAARRRRGHAGR